MPLIKLRKKLDVQVIKPKGSKPSSPKRVKLVGNVNSGTDVDSVNSGTDADSSILNNCGENEISVVTDIYDINPDINPDVNPGDELSLVKQYQVTDVLHFFVCFCT